MMVAVYSLFGARGIGRNARVLTFDDVTKTGVLSDLKTGKFQRVNFFYVWLMDRLFLSLAVRKQTSNFTHTLMQYASKTKIGNSSKS